MSFDMTRPRVILAHIPIAECGSDSAGQIVPNEVLERHNLHPAGDFHIDFDSSSEYAIIWAYHDEPAPAPTGDQSFVEQ